MAYPRAIFSLAIVGGGGGAGGGINSGPFTEVSTSVAGAVSTVDGDVVCSVVCWFSELLQETTKQHNVATIKKCPDLRMKDFDFIIEKIDKKYKNVMLKSFPWGIPFRVSSDFKQLCDMILEK